MTSELDSEEARLTLERAKPSAEGAGLFDGVPWRFQFAASQGAVGW